MRRCLLRLALLFCMCRWAQSSEELMQARLHGAQGQVTLRVIDSLGNPVEKAHASVAFYPTDSYADVILCEGLTDSSGLYCASGVTVGDITYTLKKAGHYQTRGKYSFYRSGKRCVQGGIWIPWNATNTVVLKEIRKPMAMYAKRVNSIIPVKNKPIGFDLEVGDWVSPYGKGLQEDVLFTYAATIHDMWNFSKQLIVAFRGADGLYQLSKDTWSSYGSVYLASTNGYQQERVLSFATTGEKTISDDRVGCDEYLVFRIRTVLDSHGNVLNAHYGKIYGPIEYSESEDGQGWTLAFTYYLNPTPNDRNLEFDPKRNLFTDLEARERVTEP